jgi:hypothetical protein
MNRFDIEEMAKRMAATYNLPPEIFLRLINTESGFNPNAVSPKGATGLTQLMPATARDMGVSNPNDIIQNLEGGAKYLKKMLDKYNGNMELALAAYNAGPGNVDKFGGVPPFAETQNYLFKMLGRQPQQQDQAPNTRATSRGDEQGGLLNMLANMGNQSGLSMFQNFAQALDPLILPEARMGEVIRSQGAKTQKQRQGNQTAAMLDNLEGGAPYAAAIRNGADAQTIYMQYLKDKKDGTLSKKDIFDATNALRKEYINTPETKEFAKQSAAFARIIASAEDSTGAGDMALIFNFMKLLDPGSTVREGEYATARDTGNVPQRFRAIYNKMVMGTTLTEEQRADFVDRSVRLYRQAETQFGKVTEQYTKLANEQGLPIDQIIIDKGYEGEIPEINKDIQRNVIPPKPTPSQFPNDIEWKNFAAQFATDEDWRNHWINNMTKTQREEYIEAMSRG